MEGVGDRLRDDEGGTLIDYVDGRLEERSEEGAVIDVGGLGVFLYLTIPTLQKLKGVGERVRVYSYLHVKEDLLQLYGFSDRRERDIFLKLTSVTGIGPKVAITVLSAYDPDSFIRIVATEDLDAITAISGIGRKSGQRIILELKEKLAPMMEEVSLSAGVDVAGDVKREARDALKGLGYSTSEATYAMEGYEGEHPGVEDIVRHALKRLGGAQ